MIEPHGDRLHQKHDQEQPRGDDDDIQERSLTRAFRAGSNLIGRAPDNADPDDQHERGERRHYQDSAAQTAGDARADFDERE